MNSMTPVIPYALERLLEMSGAKLRGRNRADCPKCLGFRTISFAGEVFHCFKCGWKGNAITLARELGLLQRIPRSEYRRREGERKRAHAAAERLYQRVKTRRFELLDELHAVKQRELRAHEAGPENENTWDELGVVYTQRGMILAELAILESSGAADLIRFLAADAGTQRQAVAQVISLGGVHDSSGRFVEVAVE